MAPESIQILRNIDKLTLLGAAVGLFAGLCLSTYVLERPRMLLERPGDRDPPTDNIVVAPPLGHTIENTSPERLLFDALEAAWRALPEGRLAFEPQSRMRQGETQVMIARIANQDDLALLEGLGPNAAVEAIRTSAVMAVTLQGSPEAFEITPLSTLEQGFVGSVREWQWDVTAMQAGRKRLWLRVVAKIHLPGNVVATDLLVKVATIDVEVDRWWSTKRFVRTYWQWLLGSPVALGLGAWGVAMLRRKKKNRAGF